MEELIFDPKEAKNKNSSLLEVGGRKGRFDFSVPPKYIEGVGGGKSPLYLFRAEDGSEFFYRLEKDKQGGRWEDAYHFNEEMNQIRENPENLNTMWGDDKVAPLIQEGINRGLDNDKIRQLLKGVNTHRQISGD